MSEDNIWLDEVVIYPWPSREHFKQEFLAIDITNELREQAQTNLAHEVLTRMRHTVSVDGKEASSVYMRLGQVKIINMWASTNHKRYLTSWPGKDL